VTPCSLTHSDISDECVASVIRLDSGGGRFLRNLSNNIPDWMTSLHFSTFQIVTPGPSRTFAVVYQTARHHFTLKMKAVCPSKTLVNITRLHGVTFQTTIICIVAEVIASEGHEHVTTVTSKTDPIVTASLLRVPVPVSGNVDLKPSTPRVSVCCPCFWL
jgi:hypothetical protein